jgi:hypothetical protein
VVLLGGGTSQQEGGAQGALRKNGVWRMVLMRLCLHCQHQLPQQLMRRQQLMKSNSMYVCVG